ncbi:transcriptional regulator, MarR family [Rubellimicrobium thermophilum DSM 16684]|uniref:Transcriptional regulator, MarR family n=1 Tax=Rubellimicrobium thermophilum DSM 16684 TaxID=1123069 RepID=S9R635_9RHOB|nr:ROK family transcriptional regulator [Rubellimicrobium thermophilum]EPX87367.1 transcriptional regulator, MarR family [Rubellimicrobium thermophilum DSM 16684]
MTRAAVRSLSQGATQQGVRDHNARLILSTLQRHGPLPGSDLARIAGLSPQTVSVILRSLEADGLVTRGQPQRGRVGKPAIPVALAPDGVFAFGLKLGRRSADLVLADLTGALRGALRSTYRWPEPQALLGFLRDGMERLTASFDEVLRARIAGIGIAMPYELWKWHEVLGAPPHSLAAWEGLDLAAAIGRFSDLPVFVQNDGTAAARAEHVFGRGREFRDFAYLFVGSFIGGGVVLNHSVYEGAFGNAGAFGSLPARRSDGAEAQLIDTASLHLLESALAAEGFPTARLWAEPQDWTGFPPALDDWIAATGAQLARAAVTACAVVDFEAVLIDGAFPPAIRSRLVAAARAALEGLDRRGLSPIRLEEGRVGANARALGAATAPVFARYLLNTHALLTTG